MILNITLESFARRTDKQNVHFTAQETLHYQVAGLLLGHAVTALKLTSRGLNPWATALGCATFAAVNNLFNMIQAKYLLTHNKPADMLIRACSLAGAGAIAIGVYGAASSLSFHTAMYANATAILSVFIVTLLTGK